MMKTGVTANVLLSEVFAPVCCCSSAKCRKCNKKGGQTKEDGGRGRERDEEC